MRPSLVLRVMANRVDEFGRWQLFFANLIHCGEQGKILFLAFVIQEAVDFLRSSSALQLLSLEHFRREVFQRLKNETFD